MSVKEVGYLAFTYGPGFMPIQVCKSAAGYYIGTMYHDGTPNSRESQEYWKEKEEAEMAMKDRNWTQRLAP